MSRFVTTALAGLLIGACAAPPDGFQVRLDEIRSVHAARKAPDEARLLGEDAGLQDLLAFAQLNNTGLQAAFERWEASLQAVPQATSLPDPRFTLAAYVRNIETRTGPIDARVGLSQAFPWFGKLAAAGRKAFESAEAAREELEVARLELVQRVRDAWYEYAYLLQAVDITREHRELLVHWEEVANSRYETGIGNYPDIIRAQVELGKLDDRLRTLQDLRRPIIARVNAALNRAPDAALPVPKPPWPVAGEIEDRELEAGLTETSPLLRALDRRIKAAREGITLAEKDFYPNFLAGFEYDFVGPARTAGVPDSGKDAVAVTLGLTLPIFVARNRAGLSQARATWSAAGSQLEESRNRLFADLEFALYKRRDAERRVSLFRDTLIPKGEESLQAVSIAYQADKASFLDLIDAERVLLEFRLASARALADQAQALAESERITGVTLHEEP